MRKMRKYSLVILLFIYWANTVLAATDHSHDVQPLCLETVNDQNRLEDKADELDDKIDALRAEMARKYASLEWVRGLQISATKREAKIQKITELQASQLSYVRGGIAVLFIFMLIVGGVMPVFSSWLGKRKEKKKNALDGG